MIASFRHKGLRRFFEDDDRSKLPQQMVERLRDILTALNDVRTVEELNLPGFRLHQLKGELKDFHAVTIRANWRLIFRFERGNAHDVDLVDYH